MTATWIRRTEVALLALLVLAAGISWFFYTGGPMASFFERIEQRTIDFRFRQVAHQEPDRDNIVVVEIDEASITNLADSLGRWPWRREAHAYFLDYMQQAGARLVIFDLGFTEPDAENPDSDSLFAEATEEAGNVVHVMVPHVQQTGRQVPEELRLRASVPAAGKFEEFPGMNLPYEGLWQAATHLGHAATALDPDGPWRRYLPLIEHDGRLYPSLALAAAMAINDTPLEQLRIEEGWIKAGSIQIPLDESWRLPIWYNGGSGTYSPQWEAGGQKLSGYNYSYILYSLAQLQQDEEPIVPLSTFQDKTVVVGLTAEGLHDVFTTPYSGGVGESGVGLGKMSGAEIHAHVLDNLLHNRYQRPLSAPSRWLLVAGMALAVGACVLYARLWVAVALSALLLAGYLWFAQGVFESRLIAPVVPVALSWGSAVALGLGYQYWVEGRAKRKVSQTFSRFVSRDVYQKLMDDPGSAELGGARTMVTVLFSDLRGFTSMSEGREPEEIVQQLNEYFTAMVEIVFDRKGTVDKFVGDMIMALFNTPLADDDHADHAVQCAIQMNRRLMELNEKWEQEGKPALYQGIGLNTGEMVAGVVGADTVRSYTVIGDNVNLGARLESLCKQYSAEIIISEFTYGLLKQEYPTQELGDVIVKGKSKPIKIYRVFYEADAVSKAPLETDGVMVQTKK